jgi:hypothetical protein
MAGDNCDIPCSRGRFQDGSSNTCSSCSSGKTSLDSRSCAFISCPAGFGGDDCRERCQDGLYNDGRSFGTRWAFVLHHVLLCAIAGDVQFEGCFQE